MTKRMIAAGGVLIAFAGPPAAHAAGRHRDHPPGRPTAVVVDGIAPGEVVGRPNPTFAWHDHDRDRGDRQTAYAIELSSEGRRVWSSGRVRSSQPGQALYRGVALASDRTYAIRVRTWDGARRRGAWSKAQAFDIGLLNGVASWGARWLKLPDLALVRHGFALPAGEIVRARLYVAAHGLYEARLNGAKVGDHVLDATGVDFSRRALYRAFDVTSALRAGAENVLGAYTGRGMPLRADQTFAPVVDRGAAAPEDPSPWLAMRLSVRYRDGRTLAIVTDPSWKVGTSPILQDNPYWGEVYDAQREQPGWDAPGFDDRGWTAPADAGAAGDPALGRLEADPTQPMRVVDTIQPVSRRVVGDGVLQYDFGRNVAGWVRMSGRAPAGTTVQLLEGEALDANGRVSIQSIQLVPSEPRTRQAYRYTFAGTGQTETWEPRFVYGGFRYLEVSGVAPGSQDTVGTPINAVANLSPGVSALHVEARKVRNDVAPSGTFGSCDHLLDRIAAATALTESNTLHGYPEDCPTREKKGWLGDAAADIDMGMDDFDLQALIAKWLDDIVTSQQDDGTIGGVAPCRTQPCSTYPADPNWSEAIATVAWAHWLRYGDVRVLERVQPAMERWLTLLLSRADADGILTGEPNYGDDWQAVQATPNAQLHTGALLDGLDIAAKVATVLGQPGDAGHWRSEFDRVAAGYNRRYWDVASASYGPTQAANAYPIAIGIVPPDRLQPAIKAFLGQIAAAGDHATGGFVGTLRIYRALHRIGRDDVALRIARRTDYPSYGYMIDRGPGTIWERWTSLTPNDETPPTATGLGAEWGTQSRDHPGLGGAIGEWLYTAVAGVEPTAPGYRRARITPAVALDLPCAGATVGTPQGPLKTAWRKTAGGGYTLNLTIPIGTVADVTLPLPGRTLPRIREGHHTIVSGGRRQARVRGLHVTAVGRSAVTLTAGAGRYALRAGA